MDYTGTVAIIEVFILLEHVEKVQKLKTNQDVIGITYSKPEYFAEHLPF